MVGRNLLALAALFVLLTAGGSSLATDLGAPAVACTHPSIPPVLVPEEAAEREALLQELFSIFEGLPGFIDVYYRPGDAPEYQALFVGEVPAEADERTTPVPVGFLVEPIGFQAQGPGPAPSTSDLLCSGIRPGGMVTIGGAICTLSFVFKDATSTYVSTAGHCISEGQTASVPNVGVIGTAVFSTGDAGPGTDFALIRVNANRVNLVNPEMCDVAGPTGAFPGPSILGEVVIVTGHGGGLLNLPPRPKAGVGWAWGAQTFGYTGPVIPGDSGAATRLEGGLALGTHTHTSIGFAYIKVGTRWDRGLALAAADGLTGLQLATVPYTHPL